MSSQLVTARWRRVVCVLIALGALSTAVLGVMTYHGASTRFDTWAFRTAYRHVGHETGEVLLDLSRSPVTVGVLAAVALAGALTRRWPLVLLAALGPGIAVVVTEVVLKPLVGRLIGPYVTTGNLSGALAGAFPSGHETGVAAAAVVVTVAAAQFGLRIVPCLAVIDVMVAWSLLAGVGLVRNYYHYATDTVGAMGVALAVVLGTALVIDRCTEPVRARVARRHMT